MWIDDERLVGRRLLLMLDFDGTLVPIAPRPDAIAPPAGTRALLDELRALGHRVWIVSGRRADDVRGWLDGYRDIVGLHGVDWPDAPAPARDAALDPLRAAWARFQDVEGLLVEEKGASVALHARRATEAGRALADEGRTEAERFVREHTGFTLLDGHEVLEVRRAEASKGAVVRRLCEREPDGAPVFVGDDQTDEEALAALPPDGVGVRVSASRVETAADYVVPDAAAVHASLRALAARGAPTAG
jgi:trehalose 6-phosphate phosphatase